MPFNRVRRATLTDDQTTDFSPVAMPTGTILPYSGSAASLVKGNTQWLFCDGSAVSRSKYNALFQAIGTTYGSGNGLDTFNLPDLRNRFLSGSNSADDTTFASGGSKTRTLTLTELPTHTHNTGTLSTQLDGVHTHSTAQALHNHGGTTGSQLHPTYSLTVASGSGAVVAAGLTVQPHSIGSDFASIGINSAGAHTHTLTGATASEGQGQAFEVLPPYQTVHYVIRI